MKNIKTCLLLFAITITSIAQNTIKESHIFSMNGNIETLQVAAGGVLLVGTSDGLTAIEAHKNTPIYEYKAFGKIKPEELVIMENLPYAILTRGLTKVILNYLTGKEVFNSLKSGWTGVYSVKPDFETQRIYMLGSNAQGYSIGAFDMTTLENKGLTAFSDKKTMGAYIDVTKYYESNGKLFVRTEKGIVCLDKNTFKIEWAYDDLDKVFPYIKVMADPAKDLYYVTESDGNKSYLHKIEKNGTRLAKKPTKLEANTTALTMTPKGLLVQMMDTKNSYFQMYNTQTAEKIWEKPADIKGSIFMTEQVGDFYIYASNDGLINSLDFSTGKTQLKKEIKTGMWFKNLLVLENDVVFYITSTNMGMANLKTGEYVQDPIKFKKATNLISAYDLKNDRYVVSTGTELFFIKKDGSATKVKDIDFKEDETPSKIEFREKGILVGAKQTNLMIDYDGKVIYESYYKAPGQSLAAKIALGALTAATASQSFNQNMAGNSKDARQSAQASTGMAGEFSKRFSATKETKDFLYILTKLDEGVGLVKLKKDSGEKVAELILKDKKPEYEVDDLFGILYFKKDKKQIVSYDLR
jgi:outer membrane protein assembly factor BamB